jgi:hypothetical protein
MRLKTVLVNPPATTKLIEGLAASSLRARPPPHTDPAAC